MIVRNTFLFLVLCIFGSISIKNVGGKAEITDPFEEDTLKGLVHPIDSLSSELQYLLQEVADKEGEIRRHKREVTDKLIKAPDHCQSKDLVRHWTAFRSWSFDSCVNFTDDLVTTSNLIWQAGLLAVNISKEVAGIGNQILDCASLNPVKAVKCYIGNLTKLKELVQGLRKETRPVVEQCGASLKQAKQDFDKCLGVAVESRMAIDQLLEDCRCTGHEGCGTQSSRGQRRKRSRLPTSPNRLM